MAHPLKVNYLALILAVEANMNAEKAVAYLAGETENLRWNNLSDYDIDEIKELYRLGYTPYHISKEMNKNTRTIYYAVDRLKKAGELDDRNHQRA